MPFQTASLNNQDCSLSLQRSSSSRQIVPKANSQLTFELIRCVAGMDRLEQHWRQLFDDSAKPHQLFQSFSWCRLWATLFVNRQRLDANQLAVVAGWSGETLVVLLPLAVYQAAGVSILRFAGEPVSQYGDVLLRQSMADDQAVVDAIDYAVRQTKCDVIDLRRVRDDSVISSALHLKKMQVCRVEKAPFVDLNALPDRDAYLQRFSRQSRKQRRKRRRQLEEVGRLSFTTLAPGCCAAIEARHSIVEKRAALVNSGRFSMSVHDDRFEQFFVDIVRQRSDDVQTRVSLLSCDDQVVAREIGIVCKGTYVAHVGVFDPAYARFAPGRLQIDELMTQCLGEGLSTFDFLAPADDYKLEFADDTVDVTDFSVAVSVRGRVFDQLVTRGVLRVARTWKDRLTKLVPNLSRGARAKPYPKRLM